jgi:hypothetical protein
MQPAFSAVVAVVVPISFTMAVIQTFMHTPGVEEGRAMIPIALHAIRVPSMAEKEETIPPPETKVQRWFLLMEVSLQCLQLGEQAAIIMQIIIMEGQGVEAVPTVILLDMVVILQVTHAEEVGGANSYFIVFHIN